MKISIITPTYNQAHFIEETLKSVLEHAVIDLEYWVIDGGSTDPTVVTLEPYKKQYKNLNYISEKDKGQADAINKGLRLCTGDIIGWINSDDIYMPNSFKAVVEFFKDNSDIGWAYGRYIIVNKAGVQIRSFFSKYKNWIGQNYSYSKLLSFNIIAQPSTFWTREAMQSCGYLNDSLFYIMDYEYWCRLGQEFKAKQIPFVISKYRFYDDAKSGAGFLRQYWDEFICAKDYGSKKYKIQIAYHFIHFLKMCTLFTLFKMLSRLHVRRK